jgi:hypothetical protein
MGSQRVAAAAVEQRESFRSGGSELARVIRLIRTGGVPSTEYRSEGARTFSVARAADAADDPSRSHLNATGAGARQR